LGLLTLAHVPLLPIAPWFTVTLFASGVQYYRVHKRSHLDTDWAREHIPWHYDHHMGPDQDANWGVRSDWVDRLLGTRVEYAGTEKEAKDRRRRERRAQPAPAPEVTPETPRRAA
jgi:sterol desaturase/sphingolipid hydroxylase (fatty acid hydroxylase superfamily)